MKGRSKSGTRYNSNQAWATKGKRRGDQIELLLHLPLRSTIMDFLCRTLVDGFDIYDEDYSWIKQQAMLGLRHAHLHRRANHESLHLTFERAGTTWRV